MRGGVSVDNYIVRVLGAKGWAWESRSGPGPSRWQVLNSALSPCTQQHS